MEMQTATEHKERIDTVVDHILKNISTDITLEKLALIANYSPFHLQKVFKKVIGQTPKQYIIKLRLESAVHLLVIQQQKSVWEIGMDCGFSSAAVFSRAFKNYFGLSPDKIRSLSEKEKKAILKKLNLKPVMKTPATNSLRVKVEKSEAAFGVYLLVPFNDPVQISKAFRELYSFAQAHGLDHSESSFKGIISPKHGHTYMAFLRTTGENAFPKKYKTTSIKNGRYATVSAQGDSRETMNSVHYLLQNWLPHSGYKVADDIIVYETFSKHPGFESYESLVREIHIPVQSV
ncbi:MAG: helix-turn-helix protein [Bacteroidetes bacterium]|jgi:AraC family transcriptional regulator|nr:helix-turn-helix protein [Bacteroidota bacterium]